MWQLLLKSSSSWFDRFLCLHIFKRKKLFKKSYICLMTLFLHNCFCQILINLNFRSSKKKKLQREKPKKKRGTYRRKNNHTHLKITKLTPQRAVIGLRCNWCGRENQSSSESRGEGQQDVDCKEESEILLSSKSTLTHQIQLDRFTKEEEHTVSLIQRIKNKKGNQHIPTWNTRSMWGNMSWHHLG